MSEHRRPGGAPPPAVPLSFVGLALATMGASIVWSFFASQPLALLHAFVVGVFLTTALGLLYQFVPVVSMAKLQLPSLAFVHLALAAAGTTALVSGFATLDFRLVALGGTLHGVGLLIEIVVLVATVVRGHPPAPARAAAAAFGWLVLTFAIGIWMAIALGRGYGIGSVLTLHAIFGIAGFFGTLIGGITFRLLRMFERVDREVHVAPWAIGIGAATLAAAFISYGRWLLVLAAGALCIDLFRIARVRNPAYQRETLFYGIASALGALAAALLFAAHREADSVFCAVWFFIGTAIVGYLQRIVPFIWWVRRAKAEGAKNIPTLGDMNNSRLGYLILAAWLAAGLVRVGDPGGAVAPALALLAWGLLMAQLLRAFTRGRPSVVASQLQETQ